MVEGSDALVRFAYTQSWIVEKEWQKVRVEKLVPSVVLLVLRQTRR